MVNIPVVLTLTLEATLGAAIDQGKYLRLPLFLFSPGRREMVCRRLDHGLRPVEGKKEEHHETLP